MPAARYWRIVGAETYTGGDLELSELHLYGVGGRIDAATPMTCSVAPVSGSIAALQDDNLTTFCRYAAAAVRSGGFSFNWDFGTGNEVSAIGVRLGAGDSKATFLAACALEYSTDGRQWVRFLEFNRYAYPGIQQYTLPPVEGDIYYSQVGLLLNFDGPDGSTTFTDRSSVPKAVTPRGTARISTSQSKWGSGSLVISGLDSDLAIAAPVSETQAYTFEAWVRLNASDAGGQYSHPIFGQGGYSGSTDQYFGIIFADQPSPLRLRYYRGPGLGNALDLIGTAITPRQEFVHCALTYDGVKIRGFLNGVLQFQADSAVGWKVTAGPFLIGRCIVGGFEQYRQALQGNLDDVRLTPGVARYVANFTPPVKAFSSSVSGEGGTEMLSPLRHMVSLPDSRVAASAAITEHSVVVNPHAKIACDIEFGGNGAVYGTVAIKADPTNTLVARRVRLRRSRDGLHARETWSNAQGEYRFEGINRQYEYDVEAWDHTGNMRSVLANNVTPEKMA